MTPKMLFLIGAGGCWLLALLALLHCLGDVVARRRSKRYRLLADAWDAAGPRWRYWILGGSGLAGAALALLALVVVP